MASRDEDLLTADQAGPLCSRSPDCVLFWCRKGMRGRVLPSVRGHRNKVLIRRGDLAEFLAHAYPQPTAVAGS